MKKVKREMGKILRILSKREDVNIIEVKTCPDHIYMLVGITPKVSVSNFREKLKGKSSLIIFGKYSHLKYKYGNWCFQCRGYYVSTVGRNK